MSMFEDNYPLKSVVFHSAFFLVLSGEDKAASPQGCGTDGSLVVD